jgi:protein SCO1/2
LVVFANPIFYPFFSKLLNGLRILFMKFFFSKPYFIFLIFVLLLIVGGTFFYFAPKELRSLGGSKDLALPSDSVYWLEGDWKSLETETFRLSSLQNKPVVFAFIYANCTTICPAVSGALVKLENYLRPKRFFFKTSEATIVVISLDPERDTPNALKQFVQKTGAVGKHWEFLVGSEKATRELATTLGMRYRKMSDGEISHSVGVTLLDSRGRIVYQVDSLSGQEKELAAKVFKTP